MFFRLCSRAPRTTMRLATSFEADLAGIVAMLPGRTPVRRPIANRLSSSRSGRCRYQGRAGRREHGGRIAASGRAGTCSTTCTRRPTRRGCSAPPGSGCPSRCSTRTARRACTCRSTRTAIPAGSRSSATPSPRALAMIAAAEALRPAAAPRGRAAHQPRATGSRAAGSSPTSSRSSRCARVRWWRSRRSLAGRRPTACCPRARSSSSSTTRS